MTTATILVVAFFSALTQPTGLLQLSGPEIRAILTGYDEAAKLELLREVGEKGIALDMTDEQITGLYEGAGPEVLIKASKAWLVENNTYEFIMLKQELVRGQWNETPDRMLVKFREKPRAVYAKWLEGGRRPGQEVIFNELKDPENLRAHAGGWLNLITVTLSLNSAIVKRDTNHTLDEMGFLELMRHLDDDRIKLEKRGLSVAPVSSRSVTYKGKRYWENVYETPGPPDFYTARARLLFDLQYAVPRLVEVFDTNGKLIERIEYEMTRWVKLDDSHFEENHPDYNF